MNKLNTCLKSGLLFLAFCFLASASGLLHAGAPLKINFQGRLEESGQPAEGAKNFVFKIYDALSAGSLVWTSQAQSVPVTNGVFSVLLETGTPVNLSTGAFAGARYVEITVDGVPLSPRQEMVSAPYAMVAQALSSDAVIALSSLEKDPSSASVINTSTNAVDWTQLKNVPAGLADGTDDGGGVTFSTAAIVSGKFSDERVSISTGAFYGGFNGADQLVKLDGAGKLEALDGSALTNVNSAPMSALTAQVNAVAASTGTLTVNLAAVVLSTGPLANSGNWNTAFGWGDHSAAGYAGAAALNNVAASTGVLTVNLAAVALSTGSIAAQANDVAASTGTLTVNLAAVALSTGVITVQVSNVAASTGTLTVNLAAVALSTGSIAAQANDVAGSTGTLTVNLAAVALSTGAIAVQVNNVAASTGTLTVNLAAVALSTGSIAAQVNDVAASTGALTVNLAAVILSTGPLANSGSWSGTLNIGGAVSFPIKTVNADYQVTADDSTILVNAADAPVTVTLPSAVGITGRLYTVKVMDVANPVTLAPQALESIDGEADYGHGATGFYAANEFVTCQSDGANWVIVAQWWAW